MKCFRRVWFLKLRVRRSGIYTCPRWLSQITPPKASNSIPGILRVFEHRLCYACPRVFRLSHVLASNEASSRFPSKIPNVYRKVWRAWKQWRSESIICTVHLRAWLKMDLSYSYVAPFNYLRTNDPILDQFTSLILSYLSRNFELTAFRRSVVEKKNGDNRGFIRFVYSYRIEIYSRSTMWKGETTDSRNTGDERNNSWRERGTSLIF